MLRTIVGWSLHFRLLILGAAGAILLFGATQMGSAPVDVVPEFTPPYVEIQTEALGLSAGEVEQLITVPMEADLLHGVAFLDEIQSESIAGLSSIVLIFKPGTDIFQARQVVTERLTQAHALPNVSKPPTMLQPLSSASRVQMVALTSRDVSLIDLSVLARWTIRPRLMSVPGVANVAIWGQRERQLQVLVDPERLRAQRISLAHVIETAGNAMWVSPLTFLDASTPGTGGFIDTPNQRLGVQHLLPIHSAEDLARVPIAPEDTGGRLILLGDVAEIVEDHQPLIGDAIAGEDPGLLLVIEKFPDANTLEVTRGVESALAAMQPGLGGVAIDTKVYRPATYLEEALAGLGLAVAIGFGLLAAFLLVSLYDVRRTLVAIVSIVVSLAIAAIVLTTLGTTINAILVAGLVMAVGLVVDEAVVGSGRPLASGQAGEPRPERIRASILEGRGALVTATAVVVVAAIPAWFTAGPAGVFLPALMAAYLAAVLAAALVALTVTPALLSLVGPPDPGAGSWTPIVARMRRRYTAVLELAIGRRRSVVAVAVVASAVVAVAVGFGATRSASSLLPAFHEPDVLIRWEAAPGTSQSEMSRVVARAGEELRALPGVAGVGAHVGRAITSDQVVGVDSAELWVSVTRAAPYDRTVDDIQAVVDGYPGLRNAVVTYTSARVDEVLRGPDGDLVVRVYGNDQSALTTKAEEVRQAIAAIDGVASAVVESQRTEPTVEIEVDLAAAQQRGIKAGDIRRAATTLLSGIQVGSLFEAQKVFEVVVWGTPAVRHSLSSVHDLLVQAPGGVWVRLGDVADVRITAAPSVIKREGVFRKIDVSATVAGRDLSAVALDVRQRLDRIDFPLESHAELRPIGLVRQGERETFLAVMAAALVGAFLLLQAATSSWRRAALMFLTVPAGLVGCLAGALIVGGDASIATIAGFVAVLGVGLRQALRLVDRVGRLELATTGSVTTPPPETRPDPVLTGAGECLPAILTTAGATIAALLPIVALGDVPGLEIVRPMAVVVIGGLITTSIVSLIGIPALLRSTPAPARQEEITMLVQQPDASPA